MIHAVLFTSVILGRYKTKNMYLGIFLSIKLLHVGFSFQKRKKNVQFYPVEFGNQFTINIIISL